MLRKSAAESGDAKRYHTPAKYAATNRKFVFTGKEYSGLGPMAMEVGDVVAVLFGGHVPYVLRRAEGMYRLIGGCYVHGIMHGEALRAWKGGGGQEETFELC